VIPVLSANPTIATNKDSIVYAPLDSLEMVTSSIAEMICHSAQMLQRDARTSTNAKTTYTTVRLLVSIVLTPKVVMSAPMIQTPVIHVLMVAITVTTWLHVQSAIPTKLVTHVVATPVSRATERNKHHPLPVIPFPKVVQRDVLMSMNASLTWTDVDLDNSVTTPLDHTHAMDQSALIHVTV
jgi:hypothetical protein